MLESKQEENYYFHGPLKFYECTDTHYAMFMKLPYLLMVSIYPAISLKLKVKDD